MLLYKNSFIKTGIFGRYNTDIERRVNAAKPFGNRHLRQKARMRRENTRQETVLPDGCGIFLHLSKKGA